MSRAAPPPALADFVFDRAPDGPGGMRPNAPLDVMVQSPVVLVRDDKWTAKKKPPQWNDGLASELVRHLRDADQENFIVFLIDADMRLVGIYEHSRGTSTQTTVDEGHILKMALLTSAPHVVVCHNHPSGNPRPSDADHVATNGLARSLAAQGVRLLYHIVIGDEDDVVIAPDEAGYWKEKRVFGPPPDSALVYASAADLTTRAAGPAFGRHAIWLVKSGIVRTPSLQKARERVGTIGTARGIGAAAALAWAGRSSYDPEVAINRVAIINVDNNLRLTSVVDMDRPDPAGPAIGKQAVVQGLLSGGRAAFVVFYEDSFTEGVVHAIRRAMGGTRAGLVQLLDVVVFDPLAEVVSFSAKDSGWLD